MIDRRSIHGELPVTHERDDSEREQMKRNDERQCAAGPTATIISATGRISTGMRRAASAAVPAPRELNATTNVNR